MADLETVRPEDSEPVGRDEADTQTPETETPSLRELLAEREGIAAGIKRTADVSAETGVITSLSLSQLRGDENSDETDETDQHTIAKLADVLSGQLTKIINRKIPNHGAVLLRAIINKLKDFENAGTPSRDQRFKRLRAPSLAQLKVEYIRAKQALSMCRHANLPEASFAQWQTNAMAKIAEEEQEDAGRNLLRALFQSEKPFRSLTEEEIATAIVAVEEETGQIIDKRALRLVILSREELKRESLNRGEPLQLAKLRAELLEELDLPSDEVIKIK
ncbi:MAG: hypothetical protein ABIH78_04305 [Candidatus Peregrinibacteria bacterium]